MLLKRIRYLLIALTGVQYLLLITWHAQNWQEVMLILSWIICLQLIWYYVDRPQIKTIYYGLALTIGIVLTQYSHQQFIFMWALMLIDFINLLNDKYLWLAYGLMLMNSLLVTLMYPSPFNICLLLVLLMVMGLALLLKPYIQEFQDLKDQYYSYQQERQEQAESTAYLKNHIQNMKDLYTLNERNRISRDIHDSIGHVLSTIIIQLGAMTALTQKSHPQVSQMSQELRDFSQKGLQDIRNIVHQMKPAEFQRVSLMVRLKEMIEEFEQLSGIAVLINYNTAMWKLSEDQEEVIFKATQEFLANTAKHAQASEIRFNIHFTDDIVIINLSDNGIGVDTITPHLGLMGLEERIHHIGGKVSYHSRLGQGFRTRIVLNKGGRRSDESTISG